MKTMWAEFYDLDTGRGLTFEVLAVSIRGPVIRLLIPYRACPGPSDAWMFLCMGTDARISLDGVTWPDFGVASEPWPDFKNVNGDAIWALQGANKQ